MKRRLPIIGIAVGAILALGPIWGFIATTFGMMRAFRTLAGSGVSDPRALSSDIGLVMHFQFIGIVACPVGIALLIFSVIKLQATYRQPPPLPPRVSENSHFKE